MTRRSDTVQFESLNRRQISADVYSILKEKILSCELAPGERLAVDSIARQLTISRTPVKDALARLSAEGLVEIRARKGTFVTRVDPEEIRESFEVLVALEAKACEMLEGRIDAEKLNALRDVSQRQTTSGVSLANSAALDARFHQLLVEYSGNRKLLDLYMRLSAHLQIARMHYSSDDWKGRLDQSREEHLAILNAIAENAFQQANQLLRQHIQATRDRLIQDITASPKPANHK